MKKVQVKIKMKKTMGETVYLRRLELSDAEPMLEWMLEPSIYEKMQYNPKEQSLEKCMEFIKHSWTEKENLHYAITNGEKEYLGTVSLKNVDRVNNNAEFAIALHPKAIGKQIASTALRLIMEIAFEELKLNKVYLYVRSDNARAIAFYKKNHLEYEGCFKEQLKIGESYKDIYWYALRRIEYPCWKQIGH